jgi:hypothetical protein
LKRMIAVSAVASIVLASGAWAKPSPQQEHGVSQGGSNDRIVKMRMEIAAANMTYDERIAAAKGATITRGPPLITVRPNDGLWRIRPDVVVRLHQGQARSSTGDTRSTLFSKDSTS